MEIVLILIEKSRSIFPERQWSMYVSFVYMPLSFCFWDHSFPIWVKMNKTAGIRKSLSNLIPWAPLCEVGNSFIW